MIYHGGPTNSVKTHTALEALAEARHQVALTLGDLAGSLQEKGRDAEAARLEIVEQERVTMLRNAVEDGLVEYMPR